MIKLIAALLIAEQLTAPATYKTTATVTETTDHTVYFSTQYGEFSALTYEAAETYYRIGSTIAVILNDNGTPDDYADDICTAADYLKPLPCSYDRMSVK